MSNGSAVPAPELRHPAAEGRSRGRPGRRPAGGRRPGTGSSCASPREHVAGDDGAGRRDRGRPRRRRARARGHRRVPGRAGRAARSCAWTGSTTRRAGASRRQRALRGRHRLARADDPPVRPDDARGVPRARSSSTPPRSSAFLRFYAEACIARASTPLIENVPPVLRMRTGGVFLSPVGGHWRDLMCGAIASRRSRFTLDTSHAALFAQLRRCLPDRSSDSPPMTTWRSSATWRSCCR